MTRLGRTQVSALRHHYNHPIIISEGGITLDQADEVASFISMVMSASITAVKAFEADMLDEDTNRFVTCVAIICDPILSGTEDRHQITAICNTIEQNIKAILWTYVESGRLALV